MGISQNYSGSRPGRWTSAQCGLSGTSSCHAMLFNLKSFVSAKKVAPPQREGCRFLQKQLHNAPVLDKEPGPADQSALIYLLALTEFMLGRMLPEDAAGSLTPQEKLPCPAKFAEAEDKAPSPSDREKTPIARYPSSVVWKGCGHIGLFLRLLHFLAKFFYISCLSQKKFQSHKRPTEVDLIWWICVNPPGFTHNLAGKVASGKAPMPLRQWRVLPQNLRYLLSLTTILNCLVLMRFFKCHDHCFDSQYEIQQVWRWRLH